jgi:hypothetical protein
MHQILESASPRVNLIRFSTPLAQFRNCGSALSRSGYEISNLQTYRRKRAKQEAHHPFATFQCKSIDKLVDNHRKKKVGIPRRHKAMVQYQGHHVSRVASRAQESKGGKNKITRNEGGAFIIVVKLLRTDWKNSGQQRANRLDCVYLLLHLI